MSRRRPLHQEEVEEEVDIDRREAEPIESSRVPSKSDVVPHNPLAWLSIPFHLGMAIFYALLIQHGSEVMSNGKPIFDPEGKVPDFGGRYKYLSHINVCLQFFFFAIQLLTDLSPTFFKRTLQKFSDFVFTGIAFPVTALVVTMFWGLYAVDRNLVYPEVLDKVVPAYLNHFWHTTPLMWAVFEMYLFHHRFPSTAVAAVNAFLIGVVYIGWIMYIYMQTKWWVYPVMKVLSVSPVAMTLFFGISMFICLGLFFFGKLLMFIIWGVVTDLELWSTP